MPGSGQFDDGGDEFLPDLKRPVSKVTSAQTLVGGAPVSRKVLDEALTHAPRLIAVDGGADTVLQAGMRPCAVVGDLDSISEEARAVFADGLVHVPEQDSTDFAKALRTYPAPFTIAVGFIGARVDHFLACLTELARNRAPCVLLGEEDCVCIAPPSIRLDLPVGTRLSLWPLGPATGTGEGLEWPIDRVAFGPASVTGTSNRTTGPVTLNLSGGPMALILPSDALPALLESLEMTPRGADTSPL
ncbi:thiamine diphosphokinase [Jannaschia rubra]|uniref:thiamine diphosphokinase n=1 Tax=Jannaschia rubra TaxID=282197 RepID=UPI001F3D01EC|nr:thiamine diphosphokinase [Jannaschia rubra]